MRTALSIVLVMLLLGSCRSGTVETVDVQNPEVGAAEVAERATAPPAAEPDAESDAHTDTPAPNPDADGGEEETATTGVNVIGADDQVTELEDPAEAARDQDQADESSSEVDATGADDADTAPLDIDEVFEKYGVDPVVETDDWCTVGSKRLNNYGVVTTVDQNNPAELETVFRGVYDSVERAAQIAPADITADMEVERWLWEQVVSLHAEANWDLSVLEVRRVVELSEQNSSSLRAVNEYTEGLCG